MNSYDRIAPVYDHLQSMVFGHLLTQAACAFLSTIDKKGNLLILGGGSGKVLTALNKLGFAGRVTYVDNSAGMLRKARKRRGALNVEFRKMDVLNLAPGESFDAVHMAFFLDQFNPPSVAKIIEKINTVSTDRTILLVSDFTANGTAWHKRLLKVMYWFFRYATGIEARRLVDIPRNLEAMGYEEIGELKGADGFVVSWVFRKC